MDDGEFVIKFVTSLEIEKNRYSCLMLALSDARKLSMYDAKTGDIDLEFFENKNSFINPFSLINVINYLLILDMIGEIFISDSNKTRKIFNSLKKFSSLIEKDIHVIVALRNSLAHNYGLINIPKFGNLSQRHKFMLISNRSSNLIEYPTISWTGEFNDRSDYSYTRIGLINLFELVEEVYSNLKIKVLNDPLSILSLKQGVNELKARFTITY